MSDCDRAGTGDRCSLADAGNGGVQKKTGADELALARMTLCGEGREDGFEAAEVEAELREMVDSNGDGMLMGMDCVGMYEFAMGEDGQCV
ncbi:hypothetical protein A0H81_08516 [Grifola frondosa]|uniref:Uncharacterized protein n=1 Tax=Grifola frondosa TaxID=5627 RepID=A0A1C7M3F5_GRIFR|nr:hypothetical protein A0H81_08516 [Grifola frondosa]